MNEMKFVCRGQDEFKWVYSLEMQPDDIDCTTMDDSEFDAFVASRSAVTPSPKAPKAPTQGRHPKSRTKPDHHGWTERELELLKSNFHKATFKELSVSIGKPVSTIYVKSRLLGLRKDSGTGCGSKKEWSKEEDQLLRALYSSRTPEELSFELKRSVGAIYTRAQKLNLKREDKTGKYLNFQNPWTDEEIEELIKIGDRFSLKDVAKLLNRSYESVRHKREQLGIKHIESKQKSWSSTEIHELKHQYKVLGLSQIEISKTLGKSKSAVGRKIISLGLMTDRSRAFVSSWTDEQVSFLRIHYKETPWLKLMQLTQHTRKQIQAKARRLGLSRIGQENRHSSRQRPIGYEIQRGKCTYRKVAMTGEKRLDWKRVDVIMWEEQNGPVPQGMSLIRKQLDKPRTMDNLTLVPIEEIPIIKFSSQLTPKMRKMFALKGSITRRLNQLERELNTPT